MQVDIDLKTVIIILFILYGIYQDKIHTFFRVLDRFMEMGDNMMMHPMSFQHSPMSMFRVNAPRDAMVPYQMHTLVAQNNVLYLYSSNTPLIPGVNPVIFTSYSDYAQYVSYKKQYGAKMSLLPVTHMNNMNTMPSSNKQQQHTESSDKHNTKRTYYSDNAMDSNWGGRSYSMSSVNNGTYI